MNYEKHIEKSKKNQPNIQTKSNLYTIKSLALFGRTCLCYKKFFLLETK